jgi:glycosyltransferase involved in cell wall biosynthesis
MSGRRSAGRTDGLDGDCAIAVMLLFMFPVPSVCCVMLANGRQQMVDRAVRSWRKQTYPKRTLLVYDTGTEPLESRTFTGRDIEYVRFGVRKDSATIGQLRNEANSLADADIIAHWDSDDWSAPIRIAEQIGLLIACGGEAVGYNEMLFWRTPEREAWLYSHFAHNYLLGTSLLYWRGVWKRRPFEHTSVGEDFRWTSDLKRVSTSSVEAGIRMVASIHPGNTAARIDENCDEWRRSQERDREVRKIMEGR